MKNRLQLKRIYLLLVTFVFVSAAAYAQTKSGYIKFKMSYAESGLSNEELAMMPEETEMWFNGDLMKLRMPMGMGMQSDVLILKEKVVLLMDLMGNKLAMETSKNEVEQSNANARKVSLKLIDGEHKSIAGYDCHKAIISSPGEKDVIVWYSDKFQSNGSWYFQMPGLRGFPLEFSMKTAEMSVRMSALEVKMEPVEEAVFRVSSDYKVMSQSDLMKMMGGSK